MAAGNQTRLGFVQQKPGSRRPLQNKPAKAAVSSTEPEVSSNTQAATPTDNDWDLTPTPGELLLQKVGAVTQSMEDKLVAFKKAKEEKAVMKAAQVTETRSSHSKTTSTRDSHKDTITSTQRTLRTTTKTSTTISKTQSSINFKRVSKTEEKQLIITTPSIEQETDNVDEETIAALTGAVDETVEETCSEDTLVEYTSSSFAREESALKVDATTANSEVVAKGEPATLEEPSKPAHKGTGKPVAEDTIFHQNNQARRGMSTDDEDNIHPLARTVVKTVAKPRKIHSEEDSNANSNSDSGISSVSSTSSHNASINISFKSSCKPIIQEPIAATAPPAKAPLLLPLPGHMSVLLANFRALENVLVFTKRQGMLCFYHKLKKHVELQSSRNFEIKHLAQFKTILPEGYKFTAAPCLFEGVRTRSILIEAQELKDEPEGKFIPQIDKRRKLFEDRLYDHIKQSHQKFLNSTIPARTDTFPHAWHPDFDLESVAQIEEAEIPLLKPTVVDASRVNLRDLGSRWDLAQRTNLKDTVAAFEEKQPVTAAEVAKVAPDSPAIKTLTALEQVKERIRLKQLEKMESGRGIATPEEKRQALIASRLPSIFDLIRFKRVEVTSLKTLTDQVVKSSRMPISEVEGKESLEMLAKVIPEWCNVFSLGDGSQYFKVLRDDGQGGKLVHDEKGLRSRLVAKSVGK